MHINSVTFVRCLPHHAIEQPHHAIQQLLQQDLEFVQDLLVHAAYRLRDREWP